MGKRQISLDKVLNDSWKRMVQLLFRPFDFKFWLIIGFCAWMTILSIDLGSLMSRIVTPFFETMEQSVSVENAVHHVLKGTDGTFWSRLLQELEPATGIIWLVAGIYVVYLLLCLAAYWIRCRFEFVLLANLLRGTQEIRKPWQEYRKIGNSYFIGSILVNCIVFLYYVVILAVLTPQLIVYAGEISTHNELVLPGPGIWICAGLLMVSTIVISYYMWFLGNPGYEPTRLETFRDLFPLLSGHDGRSARGDNRFRCRVRFDLLHLSSGGDECSVCPCDSCSAILGFLPFDRAAIPRRA